MFQCHRLNWIKRLVILLISFIGKMLKQVIVEFHLISTRSNMRKKKVITSYQPPSLFSRSWIRKWTCISTHEGEAFFHTPESATPQQCSQWLTIIPEATLLTANYAIYSHCSHFHLEKSNTIHLSNINIYYIVFCFCFILGAFSM